MIIRAIVAAMLGVTTPVLAQPSAALKSRSEQPQRAANKNTASTPRPGTPCGLGVIISIGDEFQIRKIGLLHLGEKPTNVPIEPWGLNDLVFARVRAAAGSGTIVRRIPYTKEAFPPPKETKGTLFRDWKAELVESMRQVTQGANCERYALVSKSISKFNDSAEVVQGIGIVDLDYPLHHRTYLFALSFIRIFDGRDFTILSQGSAIVQREPLLNRVLLGETILGPFHELDNSAFPSNPAHVVGNPALRDRVRALLVASLDKTLPMMLRQATRETSR